MNSHLNNFVLLETLRRDRNNSTNFLFTDPVQIITCFSPSDIGRCFRRMEYYRCRGFFLAGFFSYELGYFLEEALKPFCPPCGYPLLWFGVYRKPKRSGTPLYDQQNGQYYFTPPLLTETYSPYKRNILKIKTRISRGETYQINYTTGYSFCFFGDVPAFYHHLKKQQKVPYAALVHYAGNRMISLSPELFFRTDRNRNITVKPMKGTAPACTPDGWLSADPKNTSENVMIVDLLRNDLGRICRPGSVRVTELFGVEKYETLQQMTSTVTGRLLPSVNLWNLMKSLFPCGSVTGAPKIASMKIIRRLEQKPRNIYTGAIGYFAPDGSAAFNVAIRTIDFQNIQNRVYAAQMGVGGGIVFDSKPDEEYKECRLKAKFLLDAAPDFALIETMLCVAGKIRYLSRHLRRLKASAEFFSIPCAPDKIQSELKKYVFRLPGSIRLRLLLKPDGRIVLQHQILAAKSSFEPVIALSAHRTQSDDPFLFHKTTCRSLYDDEHRRFAEKGFFDVIFRNENDQITEGAISNIFIRSNHRYFTPPVSCGLLSGIGRHLLIKKLNAREKILYLPDLQKADQILLVNSIRGVTEVRMNCAQVFKQSGRPGKSAWD